jgi:tetratricopeptide (TPR) repeat protein/tRNA A-37 threonylcarbamoyl transferase component Bud32
MNALPSFTNDPLSVVALRRLDEVCRRFEDACKQGRRPRLEEFVADVVGPERAELLRELLQLEIHYRGTAAIVAEYEARFPDDVSLIRAVFAEGMTVDPARSAAESDHSTPRAESSSVIQPLAVGTRTHPSAAGRVEAPPRADAVAEAEQPRFPSVPGYEILAELGRGGMGVVYKARHLTLKRLAALKMILSGDFAGQAQRARFRSEAEAIARLRHPNIVQIYEVGEERGCPFFALEFVEGGSLARRIRGTPQPPRQAAELVAVLAGAMHVAHQAGVVHRDLKPANILLANGGEERPDDAAGSEGSHPPLARCTPKITDFGLAKRLDDDSGQTHSGAIMGTPSYMAPEQAEGRVSEVGPAADVYALAAILYELLTGRAPFRGATLRETIEQVCTQEPVAPTQLQPKVSRDLETICLKGLRKDPRQRYATARDLALDLQRWLDGRPIQARPVPAWERAWKAARRRPAVAALAAVVLVTILSGAAGAVFYVLYKGEQATARLQQLERTQKMATLVSLGRAAAAAGRYEEAKEHFDRAQALRDADPGAVGEEVSRALAEDVERVRKHLEEKGAQQQVFAVRDEFRGRRERARPHRDQALFHTVSPREPDGAGDAVEVRREAAAALEALGLNVSDPAALAAGLDPFRHKVEDSDLRRVVEECVEVLLAWADAEMTAPALGGDPRAARRVLDGAASLAEAHGLAIPRALLVRRARCLKVLNDPGAGAEQARADGTAPATALDHFDAALASYRTGDVKEASAGCAETLRLQPDHFWARYVRALCNLREERWGEAKVELDICLARRPDYPWLLPLRGIAYGGQENDRAAEADFAKALESSADPAFQASVLTNRSALHLQNGRRDDAERDLRRAIELQPNGYQGYVNLARVLRGRRDFAGAVKQLKHAVELRPDNPALYSLRAQLHAENHDRAAARRDFEQALAREPTGAPSERALAARVNLAHLKHQDGDHEAALADCDAVLKVRPEFAEAHRQRAETLLALGRNDEGRAALDHYLKATKKPTAAAYRASGLLHAARGEYGEAVEAYTRALQLNNDAETLSNRGAAYLLSEAPRLALLDFDAALKLEPGHADALVGRGLALMMRGRAADVDAATRAAEESLRSGKKEVPRVKMLRTMAAVRTYARAANILEARERVAIDPEVARCRARAVALLGQALELVPEKERTAFWHRGVLADPVLGSLRHTPGMIELARIYAR